MRTLKGYRIEIPEHSPDTPLRDVILKNRSIDLSGDLSSFFSPSFADLHDPFLFP